MMGICIRMPRLKIEKEGIHDKYSEYNSREWYPRDLHVGNETSKVGFLAKYNHF